VLAQIGAHLRQQVARIATRMEMPQPLALEMTSSLTPIVMEMQH
jgi:hypothetical protein